jgi:hypothetical protein
MFGDAIVWEPNVTLDPPRPSCPQKKLEELEVGSTVTVNLLGSGLVVPQRTDLSKLYVRAANVNLWKYLTSAETDISVVTGCPCAGRSVAVYAYAMWEAHLHDKRVLYIHSHCNGYSVVLASAGPGNTRVGRVNSFDDEPKILFDFIISILERREVDMVVLDGQLQWLIMRVFSRLKHFPGVRLITCTSYDAFGKVPTEAMAHAPGWSEFVMDSWTKEGYAAAIATQALVLHETVTSLDDIFYLAGGNVRLIQWSTERAKTSLNMMLRGVRDIGELVGSRGVGDERQTCVNGLKAGYGRQTIVASKYAALWPAYSLTDETIGKARATLPDNAAWQGLVTELEVLHLMRSRFTMLFLDPAGETEHWDRLREWTEEFRGASDPCLPAATPGWLVPYGYRQEGFDALYKASPHAIRAVRVTDASSHSCQLRRLVPFVEAMRVHVVEMVYVCRTRNFETFAVPTPDLEPHSQPDLESEPQSGPGPESVPRRADPCDEHRQYVELKDALTKVWRAKAASGTSDGSACPEPAIVVRRVSYQRNHRVIPPDYGPTPP